MTSEIVGSWKIY